MSIVNLRQAELLLLPLDTRRRILAEAAEEWQRQRQAIKEPGLTLGIDPADLTPPPK